MNYRGAAVGPKVCVVGEIGVVRSGRRGVLWLSGEGVNVWVALWHSLMMGDKSVCVTLFRDNSRGLVWGPDKYGECSYGNESLMPKRSSPVQSSRREKALGTRLSASACHFA